MDYKDLSVDIIKEYLNEIFNKQPERDARRTRIYTGVYGYDKYSEKVDNYLGYIRVYIGKKVSRIVRKASKAPIKQSASGRYYKRIHNTKL